MKRVLLEVCQRTKRSIFFLISLSFLLCGCADLKAIRSFSAVSSESSTYTGFTDDYVRTVERQKRYLGEGSQDELIDKMIKQHKEQRTGLLAVHKIVSGYMDALGELTSDEIISYDESLDGMSKKLEAINDKDEKPVFKKEEINAFAALSKLLAKAATDAYRQNKLKEIIEKSNDDFQKIIVALENFIKNYYIEALKEEKARVKKYYNEIFAAAEKSPPQQAAIGLLYDKLFEKEDAIDVKMNAAESYVKILSNIGRAHQLLCENKDKISSAQLLSTIKGYSKDISSLYESIKELK